MSAAEAQATNNVEETPKMLLQGGGKTKALDPQKLRKPHTVVHSGLLERHVLGDQPSGNAGGLLRNDHRSQPGDGQQPRHG